MMRGGNRQMRRMMGKMNANMKEIEGVKEVVIRTAKKEIIVSEPTVQEISAAAEGCVFAVAGKDYEEVERDVIDFPDEDVDLVCAQTGAERQRAVEALADARGDLAQAILTLKTG